MNEINEQADQHRLAPSSNLDQDTSDASSESTQSDISSFSHQLGYININVHINEGIIFIWKMVYISVKYIPLPFLPVSMVAADMTQAYVRKTDSISSKMIHKICPGRTNLQVDETPSIDELQAEVNYTTATKQLQVVDVQSKPPH